MTSPLSFVARDLYGGAISADIPASFLDASDLRQIPDHQEVFLSKSTLTSVIFEINEYQSSGAAEVHSNIRRPSTTISDDEAASTHHFLDPILPPDQIDPDSLGLMPQLVTLQQPSVSKYPAYTQAGTIVSPELDRTTRSVLPPEWERQPRQTSTETKCYQLLIRIKEYETDLVVRVNVPMKELEGEDESEGGRKKVEEQQMAEMIVHRLVASLTIKDFGLFAVGE